LRIFYHIAALGLLINHPPNFQVRQLPLSSLDALSFLKRNADRQDYIPKRSFPPLRNRWSIPQQMVFGRSEHAC